MSPKRVPLITAFAVLASCGQPQPETPAAETPAPEGVRGTAPPAVAGTPSVVTLSPSTPSGSTPPNGGGADSAPVMDQLGLVFTPPTLIARVGEPVVFTNSETLVHNVHVRFSDTDSTVLDVETDPGARAEHTFEVSGGYAVACDHHPGMRAFIFVTDAPYAAYAEPSGEFLLAGVPPGRYSLAVWSVDPELRSEQPIEVSGSSTEVVLERP
ncbi:MAG TPA: plastocyanin/azurin family copper-binding protein [Longimicrobiales bacterium]|nr:plastocyanin/azurin family copper-binding protein [Longimicrobiales bacterium]